VNSLFRFSPSAQPPTILAITYATENNVQFQSLKETAPRVSQMAIALAARWLSSTRRGFETRLPVLAQGLVALVIDSRWSNITLDLILNEPNDTRRDELINAWLTHRFADLDRINLTVSCLNSWKLGMFEAQI
jgi:hypothetical protein